MTKRLPGPVVVLTRPAAFLTLLVCTLFFLFAQGTRAQVDKDSEGLAISMHPNWALHIGFEPTVAKFVRIELSGKQGQPCIDELEIYGPAPESPNLAAAANGAIASASSCLPNYSDRHAVAFLNDGIRANDGSWIPVSGTNEWAQIELPEKVAISRVCFSRDRSGKYQDRLPSQIRILLSEDGRTWSVAKDIADVKEVKDERLVVRAETPLVLGFPRQEARFVRLDIARTNDGAPPCVDELEVYGDDPAKNLALAQSGGRASASDCIQGFAIHRVEHLNDGKGGNSRSWIAGGRAGWAQIELPEAVPITRVVFARDRDGKYRDRVPQDFRLLLSLDGSHWNCVRSVKPYEAVSVDKQLPGETPGEWGERILADLPGTFCAKGRQIVDSITDLSGVEPLLELYRLAEQRLATAKRLPLLFNPDALHRAIEYLQKHCPEQFGDAAKCHATVDELRVMLPGIQNALSKGDIDTSRKAIAEAEEVIRKGRELLLQNPFLAMEELLVLKRGLPHEEKDHVYWKWGQKYGMTVNWSCDFRPKNPPVAPHWRDSLVTVDPRSGKELRVICQPENGHMIQHPEVDFSGRKMLFSMPGPQGAFQVFEIDVSGQNLRQITTDTAPDIDNGDPCYLPDGRIIFNSTRSFTGVPCEDGYSYVANLCLCDNDGSHTRMLTFDQESNWHPSVLNNGRVLYTRYEYTNISHQFARLLFHMNPDGTGQMEYYGSNSYWPNSIFYARAIPGHPTLVVGVVCGHHGYNKTGRLLLFDPSRGRHETDGAIQTIPGWGEPVKRIVQDQLYGSDWPKFAHPWPLNETFFLVSARLYPEQSEYAIYLVDVFNNITEICREKDASLFEPIPLRPRPVPPVVPDRVVPGEKEGTVFLQNVYHGPGLEGVPPGSVEKLRLFTYNYVYRHMGKRGFGHLATPGVDGPWEPRFILGTVPVRKDGSALFKVPANVPVSVQPLDHQGRALQQMRSWFTAMPGEAVSCAGCHEQQSTAPPSALSASSLAEADRITPWRGPPRGFDFENEVQPVLDRFCVGCHSGVPGNRPDLSRKSEQEKLVLNREYHQRTESTIKTILTPSFIALHPYIRRPHAEANYALQAPGEYFADTSPLIRMLEKGHHGVQLDDEAWDRLYTWIDLGVPDHGSWRLSEWGTPENFAERRMEIYRQFADRELDVEWMPAEPPAVQPFIPPSGATEKQTAAVECRDWPFTPEQAGIRRSRIEMPPTVSIDLANDLTLDLVLIPTGDFPMGDPLGDPDERTVVQARIERPFYIGRCEVTNEQFRAMVDPDHRSGHVGWRSIDWRGEGHSLDEPRQPVVRISWHQAQEFCRVLSARTGHRFRLPSEAEWEWACRAGSSTPLWYGTADDDFSKSENLAGKEQQRFAFQGKRKWYLRDDRYDDGYLITAPVGSYRPNAWGLYDMAGNVAEWTATSYVSHPCADCAPPAAAPTPQTVIVKGGSWYDPPSHSRSASRWKYPPWRKIHNVGFRVVMEPADTLASNL